MAKSDAATRRVSNMTSSQVEHKRAIDRANQQICQRRKRAKMQWLEAEVARLTGQLDAAHARIREMDAAAVAADVLPAVVPVGEAAQNGPAFSSPATDMSPTVSTPSEHTNYNAHSSWTVHLRELLDPAHYDDYGKLGNIVFACPLPPPDTTPSPPSGECGGESGCEMTLPQWQAVPLHLPPETDLDRFIMDTTASGRRLHQQTGAAELSHAQFPSISSLLNPNLGDDGARPLTSALATHIVRHSTVKSVTTRIALMYLLAHLLRWLVCRTRQTYERLPDFLKPTHLQCTVPHPAWVDAVTWPAARDNIIRTAAWKSITFDEFRRVTGACMSVNWPYTDSGAFLDLGDGQNLVLSPLFENHIRCAANWTLSKSTAAQFPFMKEFCVTVHEGEGNA